MRLSTALEELLNFEPLHDAGQPSKPRVSRLMFFALMLWVASATAYTLGMTLSAGICRSLSALALSLLVVCAIACGLMKGRKGGVIAWLFAAVCLGCFVSLAKSCELQELVLDVVPTAEAASFTLKEDLVPSDGSYRVLACMNALEDKARDVYLTFNSDPGLLLAGETISAHSPIKAVSAWSEYSWNKGFTHEANVYEFERVDAHDFLASLLEARREALDCFDRYGGNQAGVLQALICGYRGGIEDSGEYENYKLVGLAHIIAVSGSHLTIVAVAVNLLAQILGVSLRVRVVLVVSLVFSYLVFSGCSISAIRSVVMVSVAMFALMFGRRASALNGLAFCIIVFLLLDPKTAVSVSFILSAGSTLGLILFARLFGYWFGGSGKAWTAIVVEPLALTAASGMTTQLYSMALFSQLSVVAPLANIVAAPLFTIGCVVGLIAAVLSLTPIPLAEWVISFAAVFVTPLQLVSEILAGVSWAAVPVSFSEVAALGMSAALCAGLHKAWPARELALRGSLVALLTCAFALSLRVAYISQLDELIMLDVGQGDSFVLRSGGVTVMVDTGNRDALLREALGRNSVWGIDCLLVTHPDDDHCGSMEALSEMVSVSSVAVSGYLEDCGCDNCDQLVASVSHMRREPNLLALMPGDELVVGDFDLTVLWPYRYETEGGNEDSLCILVEHRPSGFKTLMLGDAEAEQVEDILRKWEFGDIDVLKVGHHGSAGSIDGSLLDRLSPELALVSVGEGNRYGHPNPEIMDLFERAGVSVVRTDESGDARVRFSESGFTVYL